MGTVVDTLTSSAGSRCIGTGRVTVLAWVLLACALFASVACVHTPQAPEPAALDESHEGAAPSVTVDERTPKASDPVKSTGTASAADTGSAPNPTGASVEVALPADWSSATRDAFASKLDQWLPIDGRVRLDAASISTLSRALWPSDETSVRAAVILGRTQDPRAGEVLLARLEARVPERPGMLFAQDVVAAASFSRGMRATDAGARLEALSRAPTAHPALDVRVECAASSLVLGRDGAIPFLLALLQEGLPAQEPRPDWTRLDPDDERLLRLQDRAAQALSARVGIVCAFRAHSSVAVRQSEIARLKNLIANRGRASSR